MSDVPGADGATTQEQPPNAIVREGPAAPVPASPAKPDDVLDLDEFNTLTVKLGARPFLAKEPSIKTQKDILRASRDQDEVAAGEEGDEADGAATDPDVVQAIRSLRNLDGVYPQIEQVLFHLDGEEQGQPPAREFVEEHLRISAFGRLFQRLQSSGDAEGNADDSSG